MVNNSTAVSVKKLYINHSNKTPKQAFPDTYVTRLGIDNVNRSITFNRSQNNDNYRSTRANTNKEDTLITNELADEDEITNNITPASI